MRVQICASCGGELSDQFRFCGFCGSPLESSPLVKEARKTVTVVFCDLKGSTNLGEALDSESLRELMSRYFERMSAILESHGGTVEKFIGDAIMAVFGLREVHEDDALRAVRAAAEMKLALVDLSGELARRWGVTLENRIGVNTGEVVAGEPIRGQRLVTGDAVNVAARLEQAAPPNEILIGELTHRLVEDAVDVVPVEPLSLKGKAERVAAFRLLSVSASEAQRRRHEHPMVGRRAELKHLRSELERARVEGVPRMVTVLGQPGVGKSTLLAALEASVADEAQIVRGRCLSYGRGITFWPLLEIIRETAAISEDDSTEVARQKLLALAEDEGVAETLASVIGLSEKQFAVEDTFWAARRLLERMAAGHPLIVVLEDLHSAELTFLNLIGNVLRSGEAPMLLVALARHELLDIREDWLDQPRTSALTLEPLSDEEIGAVIDGILGEGDMAATVRERILEAAGGNPLFVEQMLSMMIDDGVLHQEADGSWSAIAGLRDLEVPPSIQALLAARLDRLKSEERGVLEPASVAGFEFPRGAIDELVEPELKAQVGVRLSALVARELIHAEVTSLADEGYRFDHILVRDAAYGALLKRERAVLHERFATWAERTYGEHRRAAQLEEVLGYHLEQAVIYLQELGPLDAHGQRLRGGAAERLSSAGRRALARGDMTAAANLLRRATTLLPAKDPARIALLPELGEALTEAGEFVVAQVMLDEAVDGATAAENLPLLARAELMRLLLKAHSSPPEEWSGQLESDAGRIVDVLEEAGDHAGLAAALRLLALAHGGAGRYGQSAEVAARAIEHATMAGDERQRRSAACHYAQVATYGPTPVGEAMEKCEEILAHTQGDMRTQGIVTGLLGRLEAMRGNFERARWLYNAGRAVLEEMGQSVAAASTSLDSCAVEMLAGHPAAAERELRRDYETLTQMGEKVLLSTIVGELARAVYARGGYDEAEQLSRTAEALAAEEDVISQALWRTVRARVLARRGEHEAARRHADAAVELLRPTGELVLQADALLDLAEVLERSTDVAAARRALDEALALFERKGDVVSAAATRQRIAGVQAGRLSESASSPLRMP
jgi:predicted ATPase/class 3 adenylate cyclase